MSGDPRPIDHVAYGAVTALHGVLAANLEVVAVLVTHQHRLDIRPFLTVIDGLINTIYALQLGEEWRDARMQLLLLAYRHRDLIQALASPDPEHFRTAAAELDEAQTLAAVALHRLAERLGLLLERVLSA
jgi:hypothetical protein